MRNPSISVSFVTLYLVIYALLATFTSFERGVMLMFLLSPILVLWMVYTVLKYGKPSNKRFDEHFYEDYDCKKIPDKD